MADLYRDFGDANEAVAKIINDMCTHGNPSGKSFWGKGVYLEPDTLSRESPDTQRDVYDFFTRPCDA